MSHCHGVHPWISGETDGAGTVEIRWANIRARPYPADGRTSTELIAAADRALYRVKREGGHDAAGAEGDAA